MTDPSAKCSRKNSKKSMDDDSNLQIRIQVAQAASSVIPFHCVICFDEFNTTDRPPMVLPCGHTFVCLQCTKRLKKCMECRESLFLTLAESSNDNKRMTSVNNSSNNNASSNSNINNTARLVRGHAPPPPPPPQPPHKAQKIPLPIPKNLVLLAMMEAAERTQKSKTLQQQTGKNMEQYDNDEDDDENPEDENAFDQKRIIDSMATLTGPCGTYAVRDAEGLVVLPQDPRRGAIRRQRPPPFTAVEPEHVNMLQYHRDHGFTDETKIVDEMLLYHDDHNYANNNNHDFLANLSAQNQFDYSPVRYTATATTTKRQVHHQHSSHQPYYSHKILRAPSLGSLTEDSEYPQQQQQQQQGSSPTRTQPQQYHNKRGTNGSGSSMSFTSMTGPISREPFLVEYGQKLQVVNLEDGVATLARNAGFILVATPNTQLVKVGGPLEASCQWEGLLDTIHKQRLEMQTALDQQFDLEHTVQQRIVQAQLQPPQYPIISERPPPVESPVPPPPPPPPTTTTTTTNNTNKQDEGQSRGAATPNALAVQQQQLWNGPEPDFCYSGFDTILGCEDEDMDIVPTCLVIPHSPNSIDNSDLPQTTATATANTNTTTGSEVAMAYDAGCLSALLGGAAVPVGQAILQSLDLDTAKSLDRGTMTMPLKSSPRQYSAQHQRSSSQNNVLSSSSSTTPSSFFLTTTNPGTRTSPHGLGGSNLVVSSGGHVNFRSGLSGHYGLTSTSTGKTTSKRRNYQSDAAAAARDSFRMMHGNGAAQQPLRNPPTVTTTASSSNSKPRISRPKFA